MDRVVLLFQYICHFIYDEYIISAFQCLFNAYLHLYLQRRNSHPEDLYHETNSNVLISATVTLSGICKYGLSFAIKWNRSKQPKSFEMVMHMFWLIERHFVNEANSNSDMYCMLMTQVRKGLFVPGNHSYLHTNVEAPALPIRRRMRVNQCASRAPTLSADWRARTISQFLSLACHASLWRSLSHAGGAKHNLK